MPVGVGYLGWRLDENPKEYEEAFDYAAKNVSAVWLSFGADLGRWVKLMRSKASAEDVKIAVLASSEQQALDAVSWGVDVLVIQGVLSCIEL